KERTAGPATEPAWQTTPGARPNRDGNAGRSLRSDNTAGRCQARRPGRLLEATCKRCPRGMAVTYRLPQAGGALQNPAYRLADVLQMRGSARHAGPLANLDDSHS